VVFRWRDQIREHNYDVVSFSVRVCLEFTYQVLPGLAFYEMETSVTYDQIERMRK